MENTRVNTEMGPDNSMVSVEVQGRWEGHLYGPIGGGAKPLWEGPQRRGDTPPIPPLFEGSNGGDGKARDPEYKTSDRSRLTLSAVGLGSKMADSLPVAPFGLPVFNDIPVPDENGVPDDLPVLPEEIYLMIAREYRLATVEDRDGNGWWQVRMEMGYLPRCPKRKRIINLKGFYVPRHGNQLEPVTGYFYRRLIRKMFATKDRDPRLYRWFRATFGPDDYLRPNQAAEWPFIHCRYCGESHECGNEEEEEERQYQKDQRAYRKKMRRVANVWAQRDWQTRLRPRRPKT